jgi:hypothetical protein
VTNIQQASRFTHANAFIDMLDDGDDFVLRQSGIEKDGVSTLGKSFATFEAVEQANVFVFAVQGSNADIFSTANAVVGTVFIGAAKSIKIVHEHLLGKQTPEKSMPERENEILRVCPSLVGGTMLK